MEKEGSLFYSLKAHLPAAINCVLYITNKSVAFVMVMKLCNIITNDEFLVFECV